MDPVDLERLIDRELRELPRPCAPQTLAPRVMAAVHARARAGGRPPARVGWRGWRLAGVGLAALVMAALVAWLPLPVPEAGQVVAAGRATAATVSAIGVLVRALLAPIIVCAVTTVLILAFVYSAIWTALRYIAFGGVSHS